jgi:hypothetical protein
MYLVAMAWLYVVVLMAIAEGVSDGGTWLGAAITFLLYGALPLGIALYLLATPSRRRAETATSIAQRDPDGGSHASADAVATIRVEP